MSDTADTFRRKVGTALLMSDPFTGGVDKAYKRYVRDAYLMLASPTARQEACKLLEDGMKGAINNLDLARARAYLILLETLKEIGR